MTMETIESRLAALEKLYADQSLELATCRLEVTALQDIAIISLNTDFEDFDEMSRFPEKIKGLLPSEPTSAAARQLLGLPIKGVWMQEEPEPKKRVYPEIEWKQYTVLIKCAYVGKIQVGMASPQCAEFGSGRLAKMVQTNSIEEGMYFVESKFREWFDSLFDQPQADATK